MTEISEFFPKVKNYIDEELKDFAFKYDRELEEVQAEIIENNSSKLANELLDLMQIMHSLSYKFNFKLNYEMYKKRPQQWEYDRLLALRGVLFGIALGEDDTNIQVLAQNIFNVAYGYFLRLSKGNFSPEYKLKQHCKKIHGYVKERGYKYAE